MNVIGCLIFTALMVSCGDGSVGNRVVGDETPIMSLLPQPQISASGLKKAGTEVIDVPTLKNSKPVMLWAYYTDNVSGRWYISFVGSGGDVKQAVYSLMAIKNGKAGWGTVGNQVAKIDLTDQIIKVDPNLDNDHSDWYEDLGWGEWIEDKQIHQDRQLIQGTNVNIKWYFFQDIKTGIWYIVNVSGYGSGVIIYQFSSMNGEYYWIPVDTTDIAADFYIDRGKRKKVRLGKESLANQLDLGPIRKSVVRYIANAVLPRLGGTWDQKVETAALATWWSLREGIPGWEIPEEIYDSSRHKSRYNPHIFSNCYPGDKKLLELVICPPAQNGTKMWQVGLAGIQVYDHPDDQITKEIAKLYPGWSEESILDEAARIAGFNPVDQPGDSIYNGIVNSTETLKRSWLLRHPVIGMSLEAPVVKEECFGSRNPLPNWCSSSSVTLDQLKEVFRAEEVFQ